MKDIVKYHLRFLCDQPGKLNIENLLIKDSLAGLNKAPLETCSAKVFFGDNFMENFH